MGVEERGPIMAHRPSRKTWFSIVVAACALGLGALPPGCDAGGGSFETRSSAGRPEPVADSIEARLRVEALRARFQARVLPLPRGPALAAAFAPTMVPALPGPIADSIDRDEGRLRPHFPA